jgi:GAF domain-containing protein
MQSAEDFADIALALRDLPDVDDTLDAVIEFARADLGCDHAGIHVVRQREIETAAATDPLIRRADALQAELNEGPCFDAIRSGHSLFVVDDTAADPRWPRFGPRAAEMGLRSILSLQLKAAGQNVGALNLYSTRVRRFDDDEVAMARVFAQHASVALATARREEGLRQAIDARNLIGQAQGILMERFDLSADKAFTVLRRYSQDRNIKLRAVAEQIVQTRRLPGETARLESG